MTVDEALQAFETARKVLPVEAMQWSLDHWDEAAPRFLALLDAFANGEDRSQATADTLLFISHMLGEKGETQAFGSLAKLLRDNSALVLLLGEDGAVESLPGMLIKCYDGDAGPLRQAIEDPDADPVNRGTALLVMGYLARTGRIPHDAMRAYLLRLFAVVPKDTGEWFWRAWADAIAALAYTDLLPQVETVFKEERISDFVMDFHDFQEDLRSTLDDPDGMGLFEHDHMIPLDDAIGALAEWDMFKPESDDDEPEDEDDDSFAAGDFANDDDDAEPDDYPVVPEQRVNPFRNVGRNDLCPCGSGKKFKKCCLGTV
jgi:hypothetical protein